MKEIPPQHDTDTMSDPPPQPVITHPVAPRLAGGGYKEGKKGEAEEERPTPHVGPNLAAYRAAHAETVGEGSDKWWAEVRSPLVDGYRGQR